MTETAQQQDASQRLATLLRDILAGIDMPAPDDAELTPDAVEIFQTLGVTAVGFDVPEEKIKVYLAKRPTVAQKKLLPSAFESVPVIYDHESLIAVNPPRLQRRRDNRRERLDVVMCGDSISPGNDRSAGTLGAFVRGRSDGRLYGLTCNHVTGGCNNMPVGMPIVSPGVLDVLPTTQRVRQVGRHARLIPLRQGPPTILGGQDNFDASLFLVEEDDAVCSSQGGRYDTPAHVREPETGMRLQKVGRSTGYTQGRIKEKLTDVIALDYSFKIPIGPDMVKAFQGVCAFANAWAIDLLGSKFALRGDSGALVVELRDDDQPPAAIGLLFSEGKTSGKGYMLPLQPILDAFDVDLVSGHNL